MMSPSQYLSPDPSSIWETALSEPALLIGLAAILIGFVYAVFSTATARQRVDKGTPDGTLKTMTETIVMLWSLGTICLIAWLASGRDLIGLGLNLPDLAGAQAWRSWLAWAMSLAICLYLLSQLLPLRTTDGRKALSETLSQMQGMDMIMPQTPGEHRRFQLMAISAGWNEEIIFRGFLIGTLTLILPLWIAALASAAIFIGFHAYQGVSGMLRILPITLVMTVLVVMSNSLWPAIVVHIAADVIGGLLLYLSRPAEPGFSPEGP